jgi:hypothetical protein
MVRSCSLPRGVVVNEYQTTRKHLLHPTGTSRPKLPDSVIGLAVVLLLLLITFAIPGLCIRAAVDAASQPEWAFEAVGTTKTLWMVSPIVGIFVCFVGIIAAIPWFTNYKPRSSKRPAEVRTSGHAPHDRGVLSGVCASAVGLRNYAVSGSVLAQSVRACRSPVRGRTAR